MLAPRGEVKGSLLLIARLARGRPIGLPEVKEGYGKATVGRARTRGNNAANAEYGEPFRSLWERSGWKGGSGQPGASKVHEGVFVVPQSPQQRADKIRILVAGRALGGYIATSSTPIVHSGILPWP